MKLMPNVINTQYLILYIGSCEATHVLLLIQKKLRKLTNCQCKSVERRSKQKRNVSQPTSHPVAAARRLFACSFHCGHGFDTVITSLEKPRRMGSGVSIVCH